MIPGDYSPPAAPTLDQQRDALRKGLGRALHWARTGRLHEEPLLEACLQDQRFDTQVEDSRGDWLWQMIQAGKHTERFRVPLLHALYDLSEGRSANQLCELARQYAQRGDEPFRTRLYEIVEQKPFADCDWLGEAEIVELDGAAAFLFAARVRGQRLITQEWEWDDGYLVNLAVERLGEEPVHNLLHASTEPAVQRFRENWRQDIERNAARRQQGSYRERMAATPVAEVLRAAAAEGKSYWLRSWGRHASETDLQTVLSHLWAATEPAILANLLSVFSARALPAFDARLIELCRHPDKEVRRRAFCALAENAHPRLREFALTELQQGTREGDVVALFRNNYQEGDEQRILEALELPDDAAELHWLLMEVIKVLEQNPEADGSQLGIISYALTPCENCRFFATRHLLKQRAAPAWLTEECRHDSGKDCRELVEPAAGSAEPTG